MNTSQKLLIVCSILAVLFSACTTSANGGPSGQPETVAAVQVTTIDLGDQFDFIPSGTLVEIPEDTTVLMTFAGGAVVADGPLWIGDVVAGGIVLYSCFAILEQNPELINQAVAGLQEGTYWVYDSVTSWAASLKSQQSSAATSQSVGAGELETDVSYESVFINIHTAATYPPGTDYIPLSDQHNPEHSPLVDNPEAYQRVEAILSIDFADPPKDPNLVNMSSVRCVMMMLNNVPVRFLVWRFTHFSSTGVPRGDLAWFDKYGWRDSYANKSGDTLTHLPKDLRDDPQFRMEEVTCTGSNFPPPPSLPA